ncbi:phosphate uptake regulator PhoU [Candidatus Woesearchaeota archaeon]|nr:phosphate uptake regulator PhoU [Candidatus Woesearchaeota archaeon]
MHVRKLVKAGQASHTVSLPKEWIKKNKLKKGDTLFLSEKSDSEIVITPKLKEEKPAQKEITIEVDGKSIGSIQREITSAYVNNYSKIYLAGKSLDESSKKLRDVLHHFVALEVDEQTGSRISAQDLLNLKEISIEKTIRRMDMTLRSIMQDSIRFIGNKNIKESIEQRDDDVNRLYFLLFRLLKSALNDQKIAANFRITNDEILSTWYLTVNIENIADNAKTINSLADKINDRELLKSVYNDIEKAYVDVMKAYYNKDKKIADEIASRRIDIFTNCSKLLIKTPTAGAAEVIENLRAMATNVCNIARIVIDAE